MSAPIAIPGRAEVIESLAPQVHAIMENEKTTCLGWQFRPREMVQINGSRVRREGILIQAAPYTQEKIRKAVAERLLPPAQMRWNSLIIQTIKELSEHDTELLKACEGIEDLTRSLLLQVLAYNVVKTS